MPRDGLSGLTLGFQVPRAALSHRLTTALRFLWEGTCAPLNGGLPEGRDRVPLPIGAQHDG